jgi:hypothetical protein
MNKKNYPGMTLAYHTLQFSLHIAQITLEPWY